MSEVPVCVAGGLPVLPVLLEDLLLLIIWLNFIGDDKAIAILELFSFDLLTLIRFFFVDEG